MAWEKKQVVYTVTKNRRTHTLRNPVILVDGWLDEASIPGMLGYRHRVSPNAIKVLAIES